MSFARLLRTALFIIACAIVSTASAQLPTPRLQSVFPAGAKQGTSVEVTIEGGELLETSGLYFSHTGIKAEKLAEEKGKSLRFKVSVDAATPAGMVDVRSIGKYGISNPRTFVVGDVVESRETEPNNERDKANRVELNSVVNGQISGGEDVDWLVFTAKKGQRVLVECWASRIDSKLDGFMWLFDSSGKQLAASQDANTRDEKNDPLIDFEVPADGDYYVKLTDFMYNAGSDLFYRLSIGTAPSIDFVLPSGGQPGSTAVVTLYGRNLPGGEKTDLVIQGRPLEKLVRPTLLPGDALAASSLQVSEVVRAPASRLSGVEVRVASPFGASNGKLLVMSPLAESLEKEPNNTVETAQKIEIPAAITGQFNPAKDVDCFQFAAKKGEKYTIEVFAQRIGSPVDPDMEVLNPKGEVMANPQDDGENIGQIRFPSNTRDLRYDLNAGEDGQYTLRLEHLFGQVQGGSSFVYRLEVQRQREDFQLVCQPCHDTRMSSHVVYQGGRERLDILVWRLGSHNGPITVNAAKLPPGVTCEPIVIGPGVKWGTLVLTAAADAPIGESEIAIVGTGEVSTDGNKTPQKIERRARGGVVTWDTGNTAAISRMTRSIVLAVRPSAPFAVTASPTGTMLKQGEPLNIKLAVQRRADMPSEIQLNGNGYALPPGMEIPLAKAAPGQTEASVTIATEKIAPGTYSFVISGEAQVPVELTAGNKQNLRCVYPSNPITITIVKKDG